jgi:hypothetical protein
MATSSKGDVMTRLMTARLMTALLVAGAAAGTSEVRAQNGYFGQNQLRGLYTANSTAGFSSERIRQTLYNRTVPQYGFSSMNRSQFSNLVNWGNQPTSARKKPFSTAPGAGSVSPWLALSEPFSSSAHNYYTQVRPQLDQQRAQQQAARQNAMMQQQLNQLAAKPPYDPSGNDRLAPTGHAAVYMNYGGFYTPMQAGPNVGR